MQTRAQKGEEEETKIIDIARIKKQIHDFRKASWKLKFAYIYYFLGMGLLVAMLLVAVDLANDFVAGGFVVDTEIEMRAVAFASVFCLVCGIFVISAGASFIGFLIFYVGDLRDRVKKLENYHASKKHCLDIEDMENLTGEEP